MSFELQILLGLAQTARPEPPYPEATSREKPPVSLVGLRRSLVSVSVFRVSAWQPNFNWIDDTLAVGGTFHSVFAQRFAREHGNQAVVNQREETQPHAVVLRRYGIALLHLPVEAMCGVDNFQALAYASRMA